MHPMNAMATPEAQYFVAFFHPSPAVGSAMVPHPAGGAMLPMDGGATMLPAQRPAPAFGRGGADPKVRAPTGVAKESRMLDNTRLCRFFLATGGCRRGRACPFAHGRRQLRPKPNLYRTQLCLQFRDTGKCTFGRNCRYAHGENDMRLADDLAFDLAEDDSIEAPTIPRAYSDVAKPVARSTKDAGSDNGLRTSLAERLEHRRRTAPATLLPPPPPGAWLDGGDDSSSDSSSDDDEDDGSSDACSDDGSNNVNGSGDELECGRQASSKSGWSIVATTAGNDSVHSGHAASDSAPSGRSSSSGGRSDEGGSEHQHEDLGATAPDDEVVIVRNTFLDIIPAAPRAPARRASSAPASAERGGRR